MKRPAQYARPINSGNGPCICKCGWTGLAAEMHANGDARRCPVCKSRLFRHDYPDFTRWPAAHWNSDT